MMDQNAKIRNQKLIKKQIRVIFINNKQDEWKVYILIYLVSVANVGWIRLL